MNRASSLFEDGRSSIERLEQGREPADEARRDDRAAGPQAREEGPAEGTEVDDPTIRIESLERGERARRVTDVAFPVVLDNDCPDLRSPAEQPG
jgi:hypothetical protein